MPEPASAIISSLGAAINTTVTVAKFIYELKNTPADVSTCLDLVALVDGDIQHAISLREKNIKQLSSTPDKLKRLDRIIASANESILAVGSLLEGCRREAHGGQVPMKGRIKWIMGDSTAFSTRTTNLQQQHAAINAQIMLLEQLEALQPLRDLATNTTFENLDLLSMGPRKSFSKASIFDDTDQQSPPEYSPQYSPPGPTLSFDSRRLMPESSTVVPAQDVHEFSVHPSHMPQSFETHTEDGQLLESGAGFEDEDPQVIFFRELRQQEEEKRQRVAERRKT